MTRHGRRWTRIGALALALALALPGQAPAFDGPLEPVSPAVTGAMTAAAASAPASTIAPVASGSPKRGQVVTVDTGSWTDDPSSYTYAWQRDPGTGWVAIAGATTAG